MSSGPRNGFDNGESAVDWAADEPIGLTWYEYLCAMVIAAAIIGGFIFLGKYALERFRENAPPAFEAGGALPSSNKPTTEGPVQ